MPWTGPPSATQLLGELVGAIPLATAVFDADLRYLAHNEAWVRAHDGAAGTLAVGQRHQEVFPAFPAPWQGALETCIATGAATSRDEDTVTHPDGRTEHLRWMVRPWRRLAGTVVAEATASGDLPTGGGVVLLENVTEQVATRQRLHERESLIRAFFEQSPVGLNLCRLDGLWLESNQAFLDIIGYTAEEADGGLTYWQLTPRKYDADEATQLERLRTQRRYGPYEKEFIRKDGSLVPVRLNGFLIQKDGAEYIWSLIEDMTAQRELERRLEEERLRAIQISKLATLGEMAASFAHEINNPLAIIDACALSLRTAVARGDTRRAEESVTAIRDAIARTGRIVHSLRRFARQGPSEPTEEHRVARLVDDALDLCRARMTSHGVSLRVSVPGGLRLRGHGIELTQVLVNLVNNGFDAVQGAAEPWVQITASEDARDGSVVIHVVDSGPGVAPHHAEAIFRPFFTTKPIGHGTGLGLSISRNIVEQHGGTLTCVSGAAHTTFEVRLPRGES